MFKIYYKCTKWLKNGQSLILSRSIWGKLCQYIPSELIKQTIWYGFIQILIDARGFRPEEIKCTITARSVEVVAQKDDPSENAQKRTSLIRQYLLPKNAIPEHGQCCFSADGVLAVTAPWIK